MAHQVAEPPTSPAPPGTLRVAAFVAGVELRRRSRNRSAFVYAFLAPFGLAALISLALGAGADQFSTTIAIVDEDQSEISTTFVDGLLAAETGPVTFRAVESEAEARSLLDGEHVSSAILVPSGFAAAVAVDPIPLRVLQRPDAPISAEVATSVARGLGARIDAARLAAKTAVMIGADSHSVLEAVRAAALAEPETGLVLADTASGLDLVAYFAPAMGILFLFLALGFGAESLLADRADGRLDRIHAAPLHPVAVLIGKTGALATLSVASILSLWAATAVVFGASWGPAPGVLAITVALVAAVTGIGLLVAALARTQAQADGMTSIVAFAFAIVGGNFISPNVMPDLLARIRLFTPNGWALRAYSDLAAGDAPTGELLVAVAVLLAIGTLAGSAGAWSLRTVGVR